MRFTQEVVEQIVATVFSELWNYDGFRHMMDDIECTYDEFIEETAQEVYKVFQDKYDTTCKMVPVEGQIGLYYVESKEQR